VVEGLLMRHSPATRPGYLVHPRARNRADPTDLAEALAHRERLYAFRLPPWDDSADPATFRLIPVTRLVARDPAGRRREWPLPRMAAWPAAQGAELVFPVEDLARTPE
jgi:hypothetical protein